jgi:hypothetical protein
MADVTSCTNALYANNFQNYLNLKETDFQNIGSVYSTDLK